MRKTMVLIIGLLMVLLTIKASIAAGPGVKQLAVSEQKELVNQAVNVELREMITNRIIEGKPPVNIISDVKGLEKALLVVDNPSAVTRITQNLERWQNRYQYRYEKQTVLEGEKGETLIKAERKIRILFFNFKVNDSYEINEQGEIISQYRNWLSRLIPPEGI